MQSGPAQPRAVSKPPPRRRVRSESDRKKHAGWRHCPRCLRSVSTNGRNFYHHMHKCDPVFFADHIARVDATRTKPPSPGPSRRLPTMPHVLASPTTPPDCVARPHKLSEMQRVVFLQQLCFLRVYDRTVDAVFCQLEASHTHVSGAAVFDAVRKAKRLRTSGVQQHQTPLPYTPPAASQRVAEVRPALTPVPLPDGFTSPLSLPSQSPATAPRIRPDPHPVQIFNAQPYAGTPASRAHTAAPSPLADQNQPAATLQPAQAGPDWWTERTPEPMSVKNRMSVSGTVLSAPMPISQSRPAETPALPSAVLGYEPRATGLAPSWATASGAPSTLAQEQQPALPEQGRDFPPQHSSTPSARGEQAAPPHSSSRLASTMSISSVINN